MITRNREMGCVFSTQPTNANKHKQRSRKFESWITNGGISRLQKMFFKRNVVIKSFLLSLYHRYVALNIHYFQWIKKLSKVTTSTLKEPAKKTSDNLLMRKGAVDHSMIRSVKATNETC